MEFFVLNSFCNEQKKESRFFGLILFPIFYFFKKLGSRVLQGFSHAKPLFHKNQDFKIRIYFSYFPIFHFCSSEFLFSGFFCFEYQNRTVLGEWKKVHWLEWKVSIGLSTINQKVQKQFQSYLKKLKQMPSERGQN